MKKKLIEARQLALKNADELFKLAETEERNLTTEELNKVKAYQEEARGIDVQLDALKIQEEMRAASATSIPVPAVHGGNPAQPKAEKKIIEDFNILRAIGHLHDPIKYPLQGAEKEIDQEARNEQKVAKIDHLVAGGINVPSFAMRDGAVPVAELRANEQVAGTSELGGFTVGRDLVEVIGILRPALAIRQAGARILTGLQGNLDFTTQDKGGVTNWNTEIEAATQSNVTFAQESMTPHRLAAWTDISLQLLAQSSIDMQNFVVGDINDAMNFSIEDAAFNGTGIGAIPLGIIGLVPEIEAGDPDGGAMTFDLAVDMETLAHSAFNYGPKAYIVNSKTYGSLKKERTDAGSGIFTIAQDSPLLNGRPVYISDALKDDGTKGGGTDLSQAVYGNWNDLLIGNWGGANMTIDTISKAKEGMITIVTNTFWDILARRLSSFVACNDIVTA